VSSNEYHDHRITNMQEISPNKGRYGAHIFSLGY
jgi:hypothetical protein